MEGGFFFHPNDEDLSSGTPAFHPDDEDLSLGTPAEKATQPHGFCKQQNRNRCRGKALTHEAQFAQQEGVVEGDLLEVVVAAAGAAVAGLHVGE